MIPNNYVTIFVVIGLNLFMVLCNVVKNNLQMKKQGLMFAMSQYVANVLRV